MSSSLRQNTNQIGILLSMPNLSVYLLTRMEKEELSDERKSERINIIEEFLTYLKILR